MSLSSSPAIEAYSDMRRALPAWPCRVSALPSAAVAAAAGVPGTLISTAEIEPP